jgi:uncharacterized RDD family membrane protein YckC
MFSIMGGDGKEYGPVPVDQVKRWLAEGRANLDTQVRRVGEEQWRRLGDCGEITGNVPPVIDHPVFDHPADVAPESPVLASPALASRWLRLGAALLDELLSNFCALPGMIMLGPSALMLIFRLATQGRDALQDSDLEMLAGRSSALGVLVLGVLLCAAVQTWMLTMHGQTVGKRLLGIRIVRVQDDANPGFVHAVLLRSVVPIIIRAIPMFGLGFWLVDVGCIFRTDKRCLHDLIAGTKVVQI